MQRYHYHRKGLERRNQAARRWGTIFLFAIPIYSLFITATARYLAVYETWGNAWTLVLTAITGLLTILATVNSIYRPVTRFHQTAKKLIEMNDWRTDLLTSLHAAKKKPDKQAAADEIWEILHEADHRLSTLGRKVLRDILPQGNKKPDGSEKNPREAERQEAAA